MVELLQPEAVHLVGAAALPIVAALDEPTAPRLVATRVRGPLGRLLGLPGLHLELRATARLALSAANRVLDEERGAYAELLRATSRLLSLAELPVPHELSEEPHRPS